jgi:taurine--2-oxoglutarate transaminase
MNRTHVCPPCVITADEVHQGVAILDRALEVADRHTTSA